MEFQSILFKDTQNYLKEDKIEVKEPDFFPDLNLDQIINAIILKKEVYKLKPFYFTKLDKITAIEYRQEVMADLENPILYAIIDTFSNQMRKVYAMLSNSEASSFKYEQKRLFLDAARIYFKAILTLKDKLSKVDLKSVGFLDFKEFLTVYTNSSVFSSLDKETRELNAKLDQLTYCIHIKDLRVEVRPTTDEIDYSKEVECTLKKFNQEAVKDYRIEFEPDQGKTVSMVGTVVPQNPAVRTFKILKKAPTGTTYAFSIAEKYGVTYKNIKERIRE